MRVYFENSSYTSGKGVFLNAQGQPIEVTKGEYEATDNGGYVTLSNGAQVNKCYITTNDH